MHRRSDCARTWDAGESDFGKRGACRLTAWIWRAVRGRWAGRLNDGCYEDALQTCGGQHWPAQEARRRKEDRQAARFRPLTSTPGSHSGLGLASDDGKKQTGPDPAFRPPSPHPALFHPKRPGTAPLPAVPAGATTGHERLTPTTHSVLASRKENPLYHTTNKYRHKCAAGALEAGHKL